MSDIVSGTCRTTDPELWWPVTGEAIGPKQAKRICITRCPVRIACGKLARGERFGIWAGFNMSNRRERDALRDWLNSDEVAESVSA